MGSSHQNWEFLTLSRLAASGKTAPGRSRGLFKLGTTLDYIWRRQLVENAKRRDALIS